MGVCPFCEIGKEKRILKEARLTFVIFSNPRIQPGHLLVIPKRHVEKLIELRSAERKELFDLIAKYQDKILKKLSTGCEVRQNYKPYFPNSRTHVNHLHFHIHPRDQDDEVAVKVDKFRKPLFKDITREEIEKFSKLFS
jgi:diadenosine tetraphosphate (Ap4A) HIT family hydrolase